MLGAGLSVVGLVTSPQRKAGRGRKLAPNPMAESAAAAGIPLLRPSSAAAPNFLQDFSAWQADLGVVVSYGQLLSQELLDLPRLGCVNLHASLLPRWRGASPIQAAILAGDQQTGVSLQKMVLALDAGNVLASTSLPLQGSETAPELTATLARVGAEFLVEQLQSFERTKSLPVGTPQEESQVTVCRRIRKEDGVVDWRKSALVVERQVRAMAGWPCAQTTLPTGERLRIHRGHVREFAVPAEPGMVVSLEEGIVVACGEGFYCIEEVQRAGKAKISAAEFLRGKALRCGQQFGGAGS